MSNVITFTHIDDNGDEMECELPAKWDICGRCEGNGKHVNPSIDENGISADEWNNEWHDDEKEAYFAGRYDVQCNECKGAGKLLVVDEESAERRDPALLKAYFVMLREEAEYRRMCDMERRMGA